MSERQIQRNWIYTPQKNYRISPAKLMGLEDDDSFPLEKMVPIFSRNICPFSGGGGVSFFSFCGKGLRRFTPPKFNMEPENHGFQKDFPFPGTSFQVPC